MFRFYQNVFLSNRKQKDNLSWSTERLKALEQDAIQTQKVIQNMSQMADDLLEEAIAEVNIFLLCKMYGCFYLDIFC